MSNLNDTTKAAKAFDDFAQKLKRVSSFGGNKEPAKKDENKVFAKKIAERETYYKKDIIAIYKKFLSPFEALGKTTQAAAEINLDKENLLAAYNLHSALQKVNGQFATNETFFASIELESPLLRRDRYTLGGEFVYLQCWLLLENKISDYVPTLVEKSADTFELKFIPKKFFKFPPKDKEIASVVAECFYPGMKI